MSENRENNKTILLAEQQGEWKSVPLYTRSATAARENNELDAFRASNHANQACAKAIAETINKNWNGSGLKEGCVQPVMDAFGMDRLAFVLANSVQLRAYDTRFSKDNRAWAQMALAGADVVIPDDRRSAWEIDIHTILLNDFVQQAREVIENLTTLETPVYCESFQYATENGETGPYWESYNCNRDCRHAIEEAIADHFDGFHMEAKVADGVLKKFGEERTMYVIANTIQLLQGDGRISQQNNNWAKKIPIPHETPQDESLRRDFLVRSHPGLFNLFTNITRNIVLRAQIARRDHEKKDEQQPSILEKLDKPASHAPKREHPSKKKEQEI